MRLVRRAIWCLLGRATLSSAASNVIEIDVVFPRNATYRPSKTFPILLAIRNGQLAKNLDLSIETQMWKGPGFRENRVYASPDFSLEDVWTKAEASGDKPYLIQGYVNLDTEGQHGFLAWLHWAECNENIGTSPESDYGSMMRANYPVLGNSTMAGFGVVITLANDAPELDLVAATSDERACLAQPDAQPGVTIALTGQTREYPAFGFSGGRTEIPAGTCAVLPDVSKTDGMIVVRNMTTVLSTPSPTAKPCRVSIDSAAAASMAAAKASDDAAALEARCKGMVDPPPTWNCPPKENGAVRPLAVAMVASLAFAVGATGFLLV